MQVNLLLKYLNSLVFYVNYSIISISDCNRIYCFFLSGVGIDGPNDEGIILVKKKGKVQMLKDEIMAQEKNLQFDKVFYGSMS